MVSWGKRTAIDWPANDRELETRAIPGFPDRFAVTRDGKVLRNGVAIKGDVNHSGYRRVCLRIDGKDRHYFVHTLVALAFIGPRPDGHHVDHIDFDLANNADSNLRYLPALENTKRRKPRGASK